MSTHFHNNLEDGLRRLVELLIECDYSRWVGSRSDRKLLNCKLDAEDERLRVTVDSLLLLGEKFTNGNELYEPLGDF